MDIQEQPLIDRAPQADLFENPALVGTWLQLVRTFTRIHGRLEQVLARHALTPPQFDVLATLHLEEGITQQELARRLLVTKGNVCGLLDRMEGAGLIERRPDAIDRRINRIHLRSEGRERFRKTVPDHDAVLAGALAPLCDGDRHAMRALLSQIERATADLDPP
jgi:DNA-binding MarR family transcriptional regulator